ncbi:MAG TPA: tetratricopeptide repeat protein [Verrucomicrobiae bacterium]|nr:tetratricopeptide repeat protein [Verrucomicrobiae bacterium]
MIDGKSDGGGVAARGGKSVWMRCGILGLVCAVVIGIYAGAAQSGVWETLSPDASESYYNLLVRGFRAGQLSLKKEVPAGFARLADPYDRTANARYRAYPYRLHDLSYYKGRLYLYFGVTPAVMLFWPFVGTTGRYLCEQQAVVIFNGIGFLAAVGLLCAMRRRYFAGVGTSVVAACALALGLATGVPVMLTRCEVYEVAVSCGSMLTMLALVAVWCALHDPRKRAAWLAAASLAYGLAVGARPSLVFGAVVLLVPVAQAWREESSDDRPLTLTLSPGGERESALSRRDSPRCQAVSRRMKSVPIAGWWERGNVWACVPAAAGPITLIGVGLMMYNARRFDSPFEFGWHYQLAIRRQIAGEYFHVRYLLFNLWTYLLAPVHWSGRFPFVHDLMTLPPVEGGHRWVERTFGVLVNTPLAWLALAAPLAWRGRPAQEASVLRWFVVSAVVVCISGVLSVSLLPDAYLRYEVEFLPQLMLVAVVGVLGLEGVLANRPRCRRAVRWGWGTLLSFSVAFNLLASIEQCAVAHNSFGIGLVQLGRMDDAIGQYERALRLMPELAEAQNNLGNVLAQLGDLRDAVDHYERAIQLKPDYADAHNNLAVALMGLGRFQEAVSHGEEAVRLKPDDGGARFNLGLVLEKMGRTTEALGHYRTALKFQPDLTAASNAVARLEGRP